MAKRKRKKSAPAKRLHPASNRVHRAPSPRATADPRQIEEFEAILARLREEHGLTSDAETAAFIEDLIIKNGGDLPALPPRTPLEEAQGIFYRALEAKGRHREELAREALEVSPDCADAYVLLAESTKDLKLARTLYEDARVAAERVIGPERFAQEAGRFWRMLEARPYLRALDGLADLCWIQKDSTASIAHLQEVLRVDAEDHLEVRYRLAGRLLTVGDDAAVQELLERFPADDSASWMYSRALTSFRRDGERRRSWRALAAAIETNPYVPAFLLGVSKLPRRQPDVIEPGERSEAMEYCTDSILAWQQTPGAIEWLARLMDAVLSRALDEAPPDLFPLDDPPDVLRPFWQ
jgi:hypothetical protein